MTKKHLLLSAFYVALGAFLCAFRYSNAKPSDIFTLFYPDKVSSVALDYSAEAPAMALRSARKSAMRGDTLEPRYDDFINTSGGNPYDLQDPKVIDSKVEYDPESGLYLITEKIGDDYFRAPTYMTFSEYTKWKEKKQRAEYFDRLQGASTGKKSVGSLVDPIAKFNVKNSLIERLFGGTEVDIKPQGNINLTFGLDYQNVANPVLTLRQQRTYNFDFDMDINMSAQGKIGEKLNLNFNYNTQATFDFDNQMKIHYDPKNFSEDEILQNIEAGNVSMPLRSQLIKGAQNLFGVKTELKFGHLRTTIVASQQRSKQQNLQLQGGAQVQQFNVPIDEYDENRHFFISHWNRAQFEPSLKCLPVPLSQFSITRMEVWITNDRNFPPGTNNTSVRPIVGLMDLGEPQPFLDGTNEVEPLTTIPDFRIANPVHVDNVGQPLPDNRNNRLYREILNKGDGVRPQDKTVNGLKDIGLKQIRDFEKTNAIQLTSAEYTYHDQLGFISINRTVQPDQVIALAVEYTYNGVPYKIGEFGSDVEIGDTVNQNVLFLKMLKTTTNNVRYPLWDLMMKNVYAVGAANVDPQEFRFDIFYEDPGKGQKRFLTQDYIPTNLRSKPLLQVFNLDNLNLQGDPGADGIFDFVPGLTINLRSGRVMFPVLEPFGKFIYEEIKKGDPGADSLELAKRFLYTQLYDSTLFRAREFQQLNRFSLRGTYKSSNSAEISLGTFNLPRGSVRVSGGGRQLQEGVDYEIDYNIGKLRILDDAILQSGQTVNVSFEDNTLFGFNARTMIGARFDYEFSKKLTVGGTFMNLFERPLTQKVNFGDDPINNKVYGLDFNYTDKAPWLTKFVDKIPFIDTKAESSITAAAEVAALQPGTNRAINQGEDKGGTVYIDDFEGSTANLPLSFPANAWAIASVPQENRDPNLFPENSFSLHGPDSLALGANRAKMSWYIADPSARDNGDNENPYSRLFRFNDIFPNRQLSPLEQSILRPMDVTIYPQVRGPYNYEIPEGYPGISKGLTADGSLVEPKTRWAGFMRGFNNSNNDFEASNVEFIEFWMLNPYMDKPEGVSEAGEMFIELGTISEDILRDSRQYFENAMPTVEGSVQGTVPTPWGRIPALPPLINAFDNTQSRRALQDLGFDGLNDENEAQFFEEWINTLRAQGLPEATIAEIAKDPSADNFRHYRDPIFNLDGGAIPQPGILRRYRDFNSAQGNTPEGTNQDFVSSSTNFPDSEDLNRDNTLNETESYFRYRIKLPKTTTLSAPGLLDLNDKVLADLITDTVEVLVNGQIAVWYRFKLPLDWKEREAVNGIQDFRSVRFVRMLWRGFTEQTTFRFATLELGRNQWRRFNQAITGNLYDNSCTDRTQQSTGVAFDVNNVNIEENAARTPFNYTIPLGIRRQQSVGAFPDILQNEQSLALTVQKLPFCDARAIFKPLNMDLRQFETLKMFVHGEKIDSCDQSLKDGHLATFIRIGSDFVNNYYEYEVPLVLSNPLNLVGNSDSDSDDYKLEVWRRENNFEIPLESFQELKRERNNLGINATEVYYKDIQVNDVTHRVKIVGNPNLGLVKGAMVGVLNKDTLQPHCVELWVNEMRLVGFNNRGGYAGTARIDMKLADLGNVAATGTFTSKGWGGIDQKLLQRQLEDVYSFDVSTNLALDRFLPEKWGVKLPFYWQYSNLTRRPEYDPYDLDIKLADKLRDADPADRDSIRNSALDRTITRGYNFTNVRKERKGARKIPLPWNIENFSFTYARNKTTRTTPFLIKDEINPYKGSVDYTYATGMKPIYPFKKLIKKDKYLKFLTDFNFNPLPNNYGFSTNLERISQTTVWRFAGEDPALNTYYNRRFTWDRNYDLGWDIAKSLKFNFDANARSLIDEPLAFNSDGSAVTQGERRDSILTNFRNLGRPKLYTHNASLNYTLPFKSIPFMDWINVKASYTANYTWTAQSLKLANLEAGQYSGEENSRDLGNVIQNNSVRQINGDFDFTNLYNKSKYLAKINKPAKPGGKGKKPGGDKPGDNTPGGIPGGGPGGIPGGRGKDAGAADGKSDPRNPAGAIPGGKGKPAVGPDGKPLPDAVVSKDDGKNPKDKGKKDKPKKEREPSLAERIALRPLMLVRKGRFSYSENLGTVVPGFTPETKLMGLSEGFDAPGWLFVAGFQPNKQWIDDAGANGWITHRTELNQQITRNYTQNLDAGLTIEPFQDFRIELTANRQYTRNSTELFKDQNFNLEPTETNFQHRAERDLGSLTVSYFALNTLFRDKESEIKDLFTTYLNNGPIISRRLAEKAGNTDLHDDQDKNPGYYKGYGRINQEVLLPAFLAAYTAKDPNSASLDVFNTLPALNWKLQYNGLSKVGKLNKIFASVQLSHGYRSTLTMSQYNTDIFYDVDNPFQVDSLNLNYIAKYEIPQVIISEQFQPLLGLDVKFKNDMTLRLDFKKARTLSMSFVDYNLSETRTTGYIGGFGYRIKNVDIPFLTGSNKKGSKSKSKSKSKKSKDKPGAKTTPPPAGGGAQAHDMNVKFDFEYRDDITLVHSIQRTDPQPSRGSRTISINPSVDYQLNRRLSLRLFCDYRKTIPKTSQSFPITTLNTGVTVQFKLN